MADRAHVLDPKKTCWLAGCIVRRRVPRRVCFIHEENRGSADDAVMESLEIRQTIADTQSLLTDAETGRHGFLLTSDGAFLAPYEPARRSIPAQLDHLQLVVHTDARELQSAEELGRLTIEKLDELASTIVMARGGHTAEALEIVRGGQGRVLMRAKPDRAIGLVEPASRAEGVTDLGRCGPPKVMPMNVVSRPHQPTSTVWGHDWQASRRWLVGVKAVCLRFSPVMRLGRTKRCIWPLVRRKSELRNATADCSLPRLEAVAYAELFEQRVERAGGIARCGRSADAEFADRFGIGFVESQPNECTVSRTLPAAGTRCEVQLVPARETLPDQVSHRRVRPKDVPAVRREEKTGNSEFRHRRWAWGRRPRDDYPRVAIFLRGPRYQVSRVEVQSVID